MSGFYDIGQMTIKYRVDNVREDTRVTFMGHTFHKECIYVGP